jgi:hypothetical protein
VPRLQSPVSGITKEYKKRDHQYTSFYYFLFLQECWKKYQSMISSLGILSDLDSESDKENGIPSNFAKEKAKGEVLMVLVSL